MLLSFFYLLVRRALGTGRRPTDERDIELLVLRHQVKGLQRQVKAPRVFAFSTGVYTQDELFDRWIDRRASGVLPLAAG